jgi:hypothetical protein
MNKKKLFIIVSCIVLGIGILFLGIIPVIRIIRTTSSGPTLREEDRVIKILLFASMDYYSDYNAYPEVDKIEDLTKILLDTNLKDKSIPYMQKSDFREERFEGYKLLDSWGNPYQIKKIIDKDTDESYYMIWSIGPNGIDEQGKGDDISNLPGEGP